MDTDHTQKAAFLHGEGDRWFQRNKLQLDAGKRDAVIDAIASLSLRPKSLLEVGAANGHRVAKLASALDARGAGIEPSEMAVSEGLRLYPNIELSVGVADELPFAASEFDLVILGFCMYLVDPALHLRAVAEADRVLADGGALVIFDFIPSHPYFNDYAHLPGLRAHKMEYSRLFCAHPAYTLVHRQLEKKTSDFLKIDQREAVDVLVKDLHAAFPPNPHFR